MVVKEHINHYGILFYKTREEKHFNKLYFYLKPLFEKIIYRYYSNAIFEKDEIISESFLVIFKYIDSYDENYPSFYNWANTIFTNVTLKHIKKHKKSRTKELNPNDIPIEDDNLIFNKDKEYLIEKIEALLEYYTYVYKDKGALIFKDTWINDMNQEELCIKYDLKLCQIKNRMHKVKLFLIEEFEKDLNIVLKEKKHRCPKIVKSLTDEHKKHLSEARVRYLEKRNKNKLNK